MQVGFVGLGTMGSPMAANLLHAGFRVVVYNRTPSKCKPLADAGAVVAASLPALAGQCDVVITIVSNTPDVEQVLFGAEGLASAMKPGTVLIDMSTIVPSAAMEFAKRLSTKSVDYLDAPVSGGESGAKAATLSIMVGGQRTVFERCLRVFQAMGRNIVYTGPHGSGLKTKLVNQVVGAMNLLAAVEGLRLASAAGLDTHTTLQAVGAGAAGSWMLANLGPKMAAGEYAPGFSIQLQEKDLRIAQEFCEQLGLALPGATLIHKLFQEALQRGYGGDGNQALIRLWNQPVLS